MSVTVVTATPFTASPDPDSGALEPPPRRSSWSRRSFLGTLAALSVGVAGGCGIGAGSPGAAGEDFGGGSGSSGRPDSVPTGTTLANSLVLTPNVELAEDYFPVVNHPIDPVHDKVVAYSRVSGEVEAVLLQDGLIRQIYRDATQPGGWNVYVLPDVDNVQFMAAGISARSADQGVLKVFYTTKNVPHTLHIATQDVSTSSPNGPSFSTDTKPWSPGIVGGLQLARNSDGSLLVTTIAYEPNPYSQKLETHLWYYSDGWYRAQPQQDAQQFAWGYLTGMPFPEFVPLSSIDPTASGWSAVVAQPFRGGKPGAARSYLTLAIGDPGRDGKVAVGMWNFLMVPGQTLGKLMVAGPAQNGAPPPPPTGHTSAAVAAMVPLGIGMNPTLLIRTIDESNRQALLVLAPDDATNSWSWTQLTLPDASTHQVATALMPVPSSDDQGLGVSTFLDVFTVADGRLNVIRQAPTGDGAKDAVAPLYCPPIPLQPDVLLVTGQVGESMGNELLVVGFDHSLHALTADPVTGVWRDSAVQLPAAELQQVSAYRVEVTLTDLWGTIVPGYDLAVTASTPAIGLVNGLANDQTVPLGPNPVTVTTDAQGGATISMIADGLSTPTLTFAGKDQDFAKASISPAANINTFMQGGTQLNYQPPLTATTLQNAQTPDKQPVAPGLNTTDASEAVTNMSTAANWAAGPSLTAARASSIVSRRDGRRLAHRTGNTVGGAGASLDNWIHDACHGIKTAALKVEHVGFDAASKSFTVVGDLAQWAGHEVTIVVHGIEDAVNVIHAVLNKIGAAIYKAVKWLEAETIGLLKAANALADQYQPWVEQALTQVGGFLRADAAAVDAKLAAQQARLTATFTKFANGYPRGATLATMSSAAASPRAGGHQPRGSRLGGSSQPTTRTPHGSWLFNKVRNELTGALNVDLISDAERLLAELGQTVATALSDFKTAFDSDLWHFLKGVITKPEDAGKVVVHDLLVVIGQLIDGLFTFIRAVVKTLMGLFAELAEAIFGAPGHPGMLDTPIREALGIVGKLMALIGLGNVSIGKIVMLLFGFPTALAYKIAHGSTAVPFGGPVGAGRRRSALRGSAADLQFCAGATLGTWAVFDMISAAFTSSSQEAPPLFTAIDIVAPVLVGVLTVPSTEGSSFLAPPVGSSTESQLDFTAWILGLIPAISVATAAYIDAKSPAAKELKGTWKSSLLWLTSACGVFALVTGCLGNAADPQPSGANYAGTVLNNMANIVSPLLEEDLVKTTDGGSSVVAMALIGVCGISGSLVYGIDG